jgi:uncharacterized protein YhfF
MKIPNLTPEQFWQLHAPPAAKAEKYTAWAFGHTPETADQLLACVISGKKRGTSSYHRLYELEQEPLPEVGEYSVLLDGRNEPRALIQTIHVEVLPYNRITELHGFLEGEGDQTLAYWRSVHFPYFQAGAKAAQLTFTETDLVVYEYFKLIYYEK